MSSRRIGRAQLSSRRAITFRRAADGATVGAHDGALLEVSSGELGWDGMAVEGGWMPGWDVRDLVVDAHLIALNLGTEPLAFERMEDGRTHAVTMPPGSVWLNPAGEPITHKIRTHSHFLNLTLAPAQVLRLTGQPDVGLRGALGTVNPQLTALMTAVSAEARQGGQHGRALLDTLALGVATLLRADFSTERQVRDPSMPLSPRQIRTILELMRARLTAGVSVVDLAAAVGYSPDHFARCFRRSLGDTPHRYLTRMRVDEARRLLLGTDRSVGEIAAATGFADNAHLTRTLRRYLSMTPSQLRGDV